LFGEASSAQQQHHSLESSDLLELLPTKLGPHDKKVQYVFCLLEPKRQKLWMINGDTHDQWAGLPHFQLKMMETGLPLPHMASTSLLLILFGPFPPVSNSSVL
jgi:hypothetical protein